MAVSVDLGADQDVIILALAEQLTKLRLFLFRKPLC
jgi:hypothetical protein